MRKAAGILMIIGAVLGIAMLRGVYGFIPGLLGWLSTFGAVFVVGGGVYTFKGKVWGVCLASSILCLPLGIIPFLALRDALADVSGEAIDIPAIVIILVFLATAILPIISVVLRKTEWES